ncbi:bifunctional lysylphosphatidylglycerol flippase/synthetase MprF [Actinokineospora sp. HUAS TT18]|uniref:bifunctional lysylphosphatidylglycerol flippase/synthetase MprF n=1 Tax=Actinokineospora sp. HUAS TT18 TaxID=3447451 RepID=UPI003F51BC03
MTKTAEPLALDAIQRHTQAENPSAFLACNDGTTYFTAAGLDGVVAYRPVGRYFVQFGGPFAAQADYPELLKAFRASAHEQGCKVVAVQLQRHDAELYAAAGFTVNQVGASYAIELAEFSMDGTRFMRLRNKIARAGKAGLEVREVDFDEWSSAIDELDRTWLRSKGEDTKELGFLVGQRGGDLQPYRRLFVGLLDGKLAGYISYSPVYGSRAGWMHDLSRRIPGKLPGIMEAINSAAITQFTAEGIGWLHFGFTPFTGLDDTLQVPGFHYGFNQMTKLLWEYGEALYPAKTQLAYKQKWFPHLVLPEYLAFDGEADIAAFAHVFRAAGAF